MSVAHGSYKSDGLFSGRRKVRNCRIIEQHQHQYKYAEKHILGTVNDICRELNRYCQQGSMLHVVFLFVVLFRTRLTRKKTIAAAYAGMGILMLMNGIILVVYGIDVLGKIFLLTCSIPSTINEDSLSYCRPQQEKAVFHIN